MTSKEWSEFWTKDTMGWPEIWDDTVIRINQMVHEMAALENKLKKTAKKPAKSSAKKR